MFWLASLQLPVHSIRTPSASLLEEWRIWREEEKKERVRKLGSACDRFTITAFGFGVVVWFFFVFFFLPLGFLFEWFKIKMIFCQYLVMQASSVDEIVPTLPFNAWAGLTAVSFIFSVYWPCSCQFDQIQGLWQVSVIPLLSLFLLQNHSGLCFVLHSETLRQSVCSTGENLWMFLLVPACHTSLHPFDGLCFDESLGYQHFLCSSPKLPFLRLVFWWEPVEPQTGAHRFGCSSSTHTSFHWMAFWWES